MSLRAKWTSLPSNLLPTQLTRSSHALTIQNNSAYITTGELIPRTPLESDLFVLNLKDQSIQTIAPLSTTSYTSLGLNWPAPRVGSSLVSNPIDGSLYLWGGRGGKSMGTFSEEEHGEDLWKFNISKGEWESLTTKGEKPVQRSFHVMVIKDNILYLHAGCPSSGRLSTLHSLSLSTLTWSELPTAPLPGRGGTVLTSLPSSNYLARFGGFAGIELGGPLDLYDIEKKEWTSEVLDGANPEKRSVHGFIGLEGKLSWEGKKVVAVLTHGEREGAPAELGHDGAGFFHSDTFALLSTDSTPPRYSWHELNSSKDSTGVPEARGWFASSFWEANKIVMQGGLNEKNERLGDGWVLEVVIE